jgi:NADH dehydrogenase
VTGHPVLAGLPVTRDRLGRIVVTPALEVPGHPGVYGAGDAVSVEGHPDASVPVIPAALAHGRLAAENIVADLAGRPPAAIDFAPRGMLVSLGERDAVVEIGGLRFSGFPAWLFWNALHLYKLAGLRKQIQVALDWGLAQLFPRDSAIMRQPQRCPLCTPGAAPGRVRDVA